MLFRKVTNIYFCFLIRLCSVCFLMPSLIYVIGNFIFLKSGCTVWAWSERKLTCTWSLFKWVFQMFYVAYLFPAFLLVFLVISPAEGIVGGVKAQIGQFPYIVSFLVKMLNYITECMISSIHIIYDMQVSVLHGGGHACGGTLISDRF